MTKTILKFSVLTAACAAVLGTSLPAAAQQAAAPTAPANPVASGKPTEMSLSQALSTGIMTNPEYGTVAASRRATDEELNQAKALYLPSIDMRADGGAEWSENDSRRARGEEDDVYGRYDVGLTLTQMLFDGWGTKYENERQKNRV
ncbi:MAG: type I secretion protein TolC, partial [Micavibrio aeruginosavorus]